MRQQRERLLGCIGHSKDAMTMARSQKPYGNPNFGHAGPAVVQSFRATACSCRVRPVTMDVSEPTPRVNFELMQRHMHKKVLLVGQIEGIENNVARVRAADGGTVQVMIKQGGVFDSAFVQFEGIVESPTQLTEVDHTGFGSDLGKVVFLADLCWQSCLSHQVHDYL